MTRGSWPAWKYGRPWGLSLGSLVIGVVLCASPARADQRSDARRAFRDGMVAIRAGDLDRGIADLELAYTILPHPAVLYNIGRAHLETGHPDRALPYFLRYRDAISRDSDAPAEPALDTLIASLRDQLRQKSAASEPSKPSPTDRAPLSAPPPPGDPVLRRDGDDQHLLPSTAASPGPADELRNESPIRERNADDDVYAERVVSASRVAESPVMAPNATAVVTAQDIRLTGLTHLPDLLRRVAGVEVMRVSPAHSEVSVRGLNQRNSTKVLVLLDGRSVRQDFVGTTWWELIPVSVEEIDRIEIIRGPASALYGADAFSGIINIITRGAANGGSFVVGAGGDHGQARGAISIGGSVGSLRYRVGGGYAQRDNAVTLLGPGRQDYVSTTDTPERALGKAWANLEMEQALGKRVSLTVGGRALFGDDTVQGTGRLGQTSVDDALISQAYARLSTPVGLSLSAYWNHLGGSAGTSTPQRGAINLSEPDVLQDVIDVELRWADEVHWGLPHALAVGVGYRFKAIRDWSWLDDDHTQHHVSAYLQDRIALHPRLHLQLSGRVDRHPLLAEPQLSPRGSLIWLLAQGQSLRLVGGKAFRSPSFLESYLQVQNGTSIRGVSAWGVGNTGLAPESITSFELGYTNQATDYFALEANAYFNLLEDEISLNEVDPFSLADYQDPTQPLAAFDEGTGSFAVSTLKYRNEAARFMQFGGELGVRAFPVQGLDLYANYAIHETAPWFGEPLEGPRAQARATSQHKLNGGAQYRTGFGLDVSVDVHWASPQVWVEQVVDAERGVHLAAFDQPSILLVNARVGWRLLQDRLDLGVTGTNLTLSRRRQHPFGQPLDTRVLGGARLTF